LTVKPFAYLLFNHRLPLGREAILFVMRIQLWWGPHSSQTKERPMNCPGNSHPIGVCRKEIVQEAPY
jgi:hypothetical protein